MAPTRKSRSVNKRFLREVSPDKDVGNLKSSSRPRRKKLSDMLGPQWSKKDLEHFYEAYRKHGRDWRKVAATLRDRTAHMVEALYNMNSAYLSLPEGISSAVGLIAMMTDHYNVLEGSDDGEETNYDRMEGRSAQKRKRSKVQPKDDTANLSIESSNDDCLSLLKRRRVDGGQPRAVGKRTPRVPVSYLYKKDNSFPTGRREQKLEVEGNDDDIAHRAALYLSAASQRGSSPQISQSPFSKPENVKASPVQSHERMYLQSRITKRGDVLGNEEWHEGSMESKGAENGDYRKGDSSFMDMKGIGMVEVLHKGKNFYPKKEKVDGVRKKHYEDGGEACSEIEGGTDSTLKKNLKFKVSTTKAEHHGRQSQRKRNKKLFIEAENTALDALQTLADLSLMMPTSAMDSESFIGSEEEKLAVDEDDKSIQPAMTSADVQSEKVKGRKDRRNPASGANSKKTKLAKTTVISDNSSVLKKQNLGNKAEKRKGKPTELKEKLSSCLSLPPARRWCICEWFYSAIDYPWFAKREFVDYLNHVGLGHIPRLTRIEWSVIRSSLGKPRRFSENFLREERNKLEQYRESVRRHYTELCTGVREGLPTDLACPLSVGQRVIAIHPKTREVHDGTVLTVDHDKCIIQFDRPDIGVEIVMDVDCMPLNPLDNMPEALRRCRIFVEKYPMINKEHRLESNVTFGRPILYGSHGFSVNTQTPTIDFLEHAKDANHAISQARGVTPGVVSPNQPCTIAHVQAREADIRSLSELTHALDKKASSALVHLRERNNYTSSLAPWLKSPATSGLPLGLLRDSEKHAPSHESECNVPEIVKNSRAKAHAMVDTAIQANASLREGEDAFTKIREAFDLTSQTQNSNSGLLCIRSPEKVDAKFISKSDSDTAISESSQPTEPKPSTTSENIETQVPAELITSCVSTLLMLQTCTERQYPPADVAQMIDSAISSLHPRSCQNLPLYREIEMSMGRLKTQILALVPTHI